MDHLQHELKKEFQLERMILFSDAVFAIAITLLVLEMRIPEAHEVNSDHLLVQQLLNLIPKFFGFVISFFLIGLYWTVHHRIFGYVTAYNQRLMWLNLLFLFSIVLMPFTTSVYGNYAGVYFETGNQMKVPLTLYVINVSFVGFMNYLLWRYVCNPKHKLSFATTNDPEIRARMTRSLIVPFAFFLMIPAAFLIDIRVAVYIPMLIPVMIKIFVKKPAKAAHQDKTNSTAT